MQKQNQTNLENLQEGTMCSEEVKPKMTVTIADLVYYLEEMYGYDELDDIETDIYERYTFGANITKEEWKYVLKQAYNWIV